MVVDLLSVVFFDVEKVVVNEVVVDLLVLNTVLVVYTVVVFLLSVVFRLVENVVVYCVVVVFLVVNGVEVDLVVL